MSLLVHWESNYILIINFCTLIIIHS